MWWRRHLRKSCLLIIGTAFAQKFLSLLRSQACRSTRSWSPLRNLQDWTTPRLCSCCFAFSRTLDLLTNQDLLLGPLRWGHNKIRFSKNGFIFHANCKPPSTPQPTLKWVDRTYSQIWECLRLWGRCWQADWKTPFCWSEAGSRRQNQLRIWWLASCGNKRPSGFSDFPILRDPKLAFSDSDAAPLLRWNQW